ncbi:MAG: hypothetical protein ACYDC5_02935 [Candidatus Dormibacteria bacterium]
MINDPGAPTPRYFGPSYTGVKPTLCAPTNDGTDFGVLSHRSCRAWIDGVGTLHVVLRAQAGSGLAGIGRRWIQITLVVTKSGRILTFT